MKAPNPHEVRIVNTMKAAKRLIGTVEATTEGVRIGGLLSSTAIPYARITSVKSNMAVGSITLETGAQTHEVKLWNPLKVAALASMIREGIAHHLTNPPGYGARGIGGPVLRVDDGGPPGGEYRKRDGSAYP